MNETTRRYLERLEDRGVRPEALTAAARASQLLVTAYRGRFLSRPVFLDGDSAQALGSGLNCLYDLVMSLPTRLFDGDLRDYAASVGMNWAQIEAILRLRADRPLRLGRADLYQDRDGFKVLEFNVGSPLGGVENAELNRAMLDSPVLSEFIAEEELHFRDTLAGVARTLLSFCGHSQVESRPTVAIIDAPASFAEWGPRLRAVARLFSDHGLDAFACDASHVSLSDGHLVSEGRVIDVVYRWFTLGDLQEGAYPLELFEPILQAYESGQVAVFAPFDLELHGNKRALALVSDRRYRDAFTDQERELVDRLVPWTRELSRDRTAVGADEVDLLEHCLAHRVELLLKPDLDSGGAGVRPGWQTGHDEWRRALEEAQKGGYVVQRRVRPLTEPMVDESTGTTVDTVLTWGVFLDGDGYNGAYVRGYPDPDVGVVSADAGAAFGCCFSHWAGDRDDRTGQA